MRPATTSGSWISGGLSRRRTSAATIPPTHWASRTEVRAVPTDPPGKVPGEGTTVGTLETTAEPVSERPPFTKSRQCGRGLSCLWMHRHPPVSPGFPSSHPRGTDHGAGANRSRPTPASPFAIAFIVGAQNAGDCFGGGVLNRASAAGHRVAAEAIAGSRTFLSALTPCLARRAGAAVKHLRRVNLIERQRDRRESKAVSFARAPQRPGSRHLLVAAVRRAPRGQRRRDSLHKYQPGSGRRNVSPATGGARALRLVFGLVAVAGPPRRIAGLEWAPRRCGRKGSAFPGGSRRRDGRPDVRR
jgi:hypothetical protein